MSDPIVNPAPPWGSNGGPPPSIYKSPPKRARTGTNGKSHQNQRFTPPKDLAQHLARTQPIHHNPIALPRSNIVYCLRVDYGILFPYADKAILAIATEAFSPAGFIDFRPFKGYFDLGFTSEEAAEAASKVKLLYKGTPIPTTCTRLPSDKTLVINFSNLPSHLPPQTLFDELYSGLLAYGKDPVIKFLVPIGAEKLAGPRAIATITPTDPNMPQLIPPRSALPSSPEHIFWARCENGRLVCAQCYGLDHSKAKCRLDVTDVTGHQKPVQVSVWGNILSPPHPEKSNTNGNNNSKKSGASSSSNFNHESTPQLGLIVSNPPIQQNSSFLSGNSSHPSEWNIVINRRHSSNLGQNHDKSTIGSSRSINKAAEFIIQPNPWEILVEIDNDEIIPLLKSTFDPTAFFNNDDDSMEDRVFVDKNTKEPYMTTQEMADISADPSIPTDFTEALADMIQPLINGIPTPKLPHSMNSAETSPIWELHYTAHNAVKSASELSIKAMKTMKPGVVTRSQSNVPTERLHAEYSLANLYEALYTAELLKPDVTFLSFINPHPADYPTPILCALERYGCSQNVPHPIDPDPPSPSAMDSS